MSIKGFKLNGVTYKYDSAELEPPVSTPEKNLVWYGTSSSSDSAAAKTASITGISALTAGLRVSIKFTNANSYNSGSMTLNINSLGAKTVKRQGTESPLSGEWKAGEIVEFIYDGTYWVIVDGAIASTASYGYTKLSSAVDSTSEVLAATPKAVKTAYDLANGIHGIPSGGSSGYVLKKSSSSDYAVEWAAESGGGSGGTSDYTGLTNKPQINSVTLTGNKTAADLSLAPAVTEVTNTSTGAVDMTNAPLDAGKIYHFTGAITSLTIALNAASGVPAHYHFDFLSGSTAATLVLPQTVKMPDGFAVEASKRYEVDILNNYGTVMAWANS